MADKMGGFPGHDEGTNKPNNAPAGYSSPATHAPLQSDSSNPVNVKTETGTTGKPEGGR